MIASPPETDARLVAQLEAPPADSPDYQVLANEQRRILRWCIQQLGGRHARVIDLRYGDGTHTFFEIGQILRISESAAFALHGRILTRLRALMADHGIRSLKDIL